MKQSDHDVLAARRLEKVHEAIGEAALQAGRDLDEISLIAVSKTFGPDSIRPVLAAGQRMFGENRVQEAMAKWPPMRADNDDLDLHLIGPLQTNKAKEAVALFDAIHTIDRPKLARIVAEQQRAQGRALKLFVQVNTGEEPQKAGILPKEAKRFVLQCREEFGLNVSGLMCIPPQDEEAGIHFAFLAKLADELGLAELSMGMSADFQTAIRFGATHIRVGSAIFGERTHNRAPQ